MATDRELRDTLVTSRNAEQMAESWEWFAKHDTTPEDSLARARFYREAAARLRELEPNPLPTLKVRKMNSVESVTYDGDPYELLTEFVHAPYHVRLEYKITFTDGSEIRGCVGGLSACVT